jgi:DNA-binding transcriptional ArsR family regulator
MSVADVLPEQMTDRALEFVARRFRLLGEPQRLRLLRELMNGEQSVNDLAERCATGQANVSKHLGLMRMEGLVDYRREGTRKVYRIDDPVIPVLCRLVCGALEERYASRLRRLQGGTR